MRLKSIFIYFVITTPMSAFSHDSGEPKIDKRVEARTETRRPPHHPREIEQAELAKYLESKFPDVTIISCQFSEYNSCRGVQIAIFDSNGHFVAKAHSGTIGMVGFEGLKPNSEFVAKIQSEKYRGEIVFVVGQNFRILAEQK